VAINFFLVDTSFKLSDKKKIKNWLKSIIEYYEFKVGEINYIFTSDSKILEINLQFLNHNYFTDIITFPYSEGKILSADIYISVETVASNAREYKNSFNDELNRVIAHGVLHLVGFNDKTVKQKKQMRSVESFWLVRFNSL
jgi:rRNA maturation RNase YbeY